MRKVLFWHGREASFERKVRRHCIEKDGAYWWPGTLEEFEAIFPMFVVRDGILWVTHRKTLGMA